MNNHIFMRKTCSKVNHSWLFVFKLTLKKENNNQTRPLCNRYNSKYWIYVRVVTKALIIMLCSSLYTWKSIDNSIITYLIGIFPWLEAPTHLVLNRKIYWKGIHKKQSKIHKIDLIMLSRYNSCMYVQWLFWFIHSNSMSF